MYVTGVRVERRSTLRQLQYDTAFGHYSFAGLYTVEQLHQISIGLTNLYTAFLERYRAVLHKHEQVTHLLYQGCTRHSHAIFNA